MKKLFLTVAFLVTVLTPAWAQFPLQTNSFFGRAADSDGGDSDAFFWRWSGWSDQRLQADFTDVAVTSVAFRLSYPQSGVVYLDLNTTASISTFPYALIITTNESFTNCYGAITYTNANVAYTADVLTISYYADYYTNQITNTATFTNLTQGRFAASNVTLTQLVATCTVFTATNTQNTVPAYGVYTNTWYARTNSYTYITNRYILNQYGSNLINNASFSQTDLYWSAGGIMTFTNPVGFASMKSAGTSSGALYQSFSGIGTGVVGRFSLQVYCPIPGFLTSFVYTVGGHTSQLYSGGNLAISQVITARTDQGFTGSFLTGASNGFANAYTYVLVDAIEFYPWIQGATNSTTGVVSTVIAASNTIVTAYAQSNRVNTKWFYSSQDVYRVQSDLSHTSMPPDGPYYAEYLAYTTHPTGVPTRTLAKGQVVIEHSLFANTNSSSWTNPAANSVIGPPVHTLTSYDGWPFVSSVIVTNGSVTTGYIASGELNISVTSGGAGSETQGLVSVLNLGASAGTNNIDMNGQSVTNAGIVISSNVTVVGSGAVRVEGAFSTNIMAPTYYSILSINPDAHFIAADVPENHRGKYSDKYIAYNRGTNEVAFGLPDSNTPYFVRGFNGESNTIWDAGNDGTGSGLDADLLDGFSSALFPQLGLFNTFTNPVNVFEKSVSFGSATVNTNLTVANNIVFVSSNVTDIGTATAPAESINANIYKSGTDTFAFAGGNATVNGSAIGGGGTGKLYAVAGIFTPEVTFEAGSNMSISTNGTKITFASTGGGSDPYSVHVSATMSAQHNYPNGAFTTNQFTTERYDNGNIYNPTTFTFRFSQTCQADAVVGMVFDNASVSEYVGVVALFSNGVIYERHGVDVLQGSGGTVHLHPAMFKWTVTDTNVVWSFTAYHNFGSGLSNQASSDKNYLHISGRNP